MSGFYGDDKISAIKFEFSCIYYLLDFEIYVRT